MRRVVGILFVVAAVAAAVACGDRGEPAEPRNAALVETPQPIVDAALDVEAGPLAPEGGTLPTIPYWHIERPADSKRTWMVDPSGNRVFVIGLDATLRTTSCDGMSTYVHRLSPSQTAKEEWSRLQGFGFNSVGAFSEGNDIDATGGDSYIVRQPDAGGAAAPYGVVLSIAPQADDHALKDAEGNVLVTGLAGVKVGDPYNPAYTADLEAVVQAQMVPRRTDPNLQIYYAGDESGMFDVASPAGGVRDFRRWLWSDCPTGSTPAKPKCVPDAVVAFLETIYPTIAALNQAWGSTYASFPAVVTSPVRPVPYAGACNATCLVDLGHFVVQRLIPQWIALVTNELRSGDETRLLASPRLALATSSQYRFWSAGDTYVESGQPVDVDLLPLLTRFDVIAINAFSAAPTFEEPWFSSGLKKLGSEIGLPIIVSEMGSRTQITGWSNQDAEPAFATDQKTRGQNYASQLKQLAAFPDVIGVHWHGWSDHYVATDPTQQLELGLLQCSDPPRSFTAGAPWTDATAPVTAANNAIRATLAATTGL